MHYSISTSTSVLSCQRHLFNIPDLVSYINCAYMGPLLKASVQAGLEGVRRKSQPWTIGQADFFDQVQHIKSLFSQLISCQEKERIAVIPSASYGLANAAKNVPLQPGQHILLVAEQFPSNYYVWERLVREQKGELKIINPPSQLSSRGRLWNEAIINAINEKTAAVAIANVHWADGTFFDLKAIRKATWEKEALLIVDGSQSVGALPFSVSEIQPDALIVVGYKWLLGPYGTALAYYGSAFDEGSPIEENWMNRFNSEDFQNLVQYEDQYKPLANRYNVGETSQFIHLPIQIKALEQILEWGVENIQNYCYHLTKDPLKQLEHLGCFIEDVDFRTSHLIGIHLPEQMNVDHLKARMKELQISVSFRGKAIRIAPNVYNNKNDFDRLINAFESL